MATTTQLAGQGIGGPEGRSVRAALFDRILQRIHRYFTRLVWKQQDVDDLVQQTLLSLERSLQEGTYDPHRSFNRWMWIKAHDVFVGYCRARSRAPGGLPEEEVLEEDGAPPSGEVDARLDAEEVMDRLRTRLEPEAFEMFVLFYGEGHSVTEVAGIIGRDRKTVRKRLQSAKRAALQLLG